MEKEKKPKTKRPGDESDSSDSEPANITVVEVMATDSQDAVSRPAGQPTANKDTAKLIEGMENIDLTKKTKLSGAQRKKLIRERKMAAGTWTAENPAKQKRLEQKRRQGGVGPSGEDNQKKRPRPDSQTPPSRPNVKRARNTEVSTGTYSETARGIRMAVINRRHPDVLMNQEQSELVQNAIVEALYQTPSGSGSALQFERTSFSAGVLSMTCANERTAHWLREAVSSLGSLWEGAELTVVNFKDLPVRHRVLVFVPGSVREEPAEFRRRLQIQNPDLRTQEWTLLSRNTEREGGQLLAFSVDEVSFRSLERTNFRAYYRLGRVLFTYLKKRKTDGGDKGNPDQPPAL